MKLIDLNGILYSISNPADLGYVVAECDAAGKFTWAQYAPDYNQAEEALIARALLNSRGALIYLDPAVQLLREDSPCSAPMKPVLVDSNGQHVWSRGETGFTYKQVVELSRVIVTDGVEGTRELRNERRSFYIAIHTAGRFVPKQLREGPALQAMLSEGIVDTFDACELALGNGARMIYDPTALQVLIRTAKKVHHAFVLDSPKFRSAFDPFGGLGEAKPIPNGSGIPWSANWKKALMAAEPLELRRCLKFAIAELLSMAKVRVNEVPRSGMDRLLAEDHHIVARHHDAKEQAHDCCSMDSGWTKES